MQTRVKHQKWLAMLVAIALFVGTFSVFTVFSAGSTNLLETLADKVSTEDTVDEAANTITMKDYTGQLQCATYANITLEKAKTYEYSFTANMTKADAAGSSLRIPIRVSKANDYAASGQWLNIWFDFDQIRLASVNDGNVSLDGAGWTLGEDLASKDFVAGTDYQFKIVTAPDKMTVYIDNEKVAETTVVDTAKVDTGYIGFGCYNLAPYTLKNISLVEQEAEAVNLLENAAVAWDTAKYTVDAATNSITVKEAGDHAITFTNASLEKKGIYEYSFTLNIKEADSIQLRMPIRVSNSNDTSASGQWMAAWFSLNQIRLATEYSGNIIADGSSVGAKEIQAGTDYQFKIVTSPTQMIVYVDGVQIAQTQADSYTPVETGYVGFGGYGMKEYTLKNISLVKTGEVEVLIDQAAVDNVKNLIAAIGTVTEESGDKITAARAAYDALNNDEKALIDNYAVLTEAEAAYTLLSASSDFHYYPIAIGDLLGYNHWQGAGFLSTAALSGGGVRFVFNDAGTNIRMGINKPLQVDGMHMELANLNVSAGGRIAFYLADITNEGYSQLNTGYGYKFAPMAIVLDTTKGTIEYMSVDWTPDPNDPNITGTVIANELVQSDSLKAENLANKNISVRLSDNKDGSYKVTIQGVSGTITKAMLDTNTLLKDFENAYLTISVNGGGNTLSVDLISLHGGQETCASALSKAEIAEVDAVISLIGEIGDVTAESGTKITAAENAYNALTDTQKGLVNNYGALRAAKLLYDRINATDLYQDIKYYSLTTDDLMGTNHWADYLSYNNVAGGGVHFKWFNSGTDVRMGVNRAMALDGLHIVIDNLNITAGSTLAFYIADLFDFDWAEQYSQFSNGSPLALLLDTKTGTLSVASKDENGSTVQTVIISDSSLTYSMLSKVQFDLKITKNANDDNYTVRILDAQGTITPQMIEKAENLNKLDQVYLTVCPWGSGVNMEYDLLALHGGNVVCADEITDAQRAELEAVVAAIVNIYNEKGQIDAASGAKIEAAWALYNKLPADIKALVSNVKQLETADLVYQVVDAIEHIGTVTLDSKELIESIRSDYKALIGILNNQVGDYRALDTSNRALVGNYATLNAAIAQLYGLEKEAAIAAMQNGGSNNNNNNNQNGNMPNTDASATGAFALACLISAAGAAIVLRKRNVFDKTASK